VIPITLFQKIDSRIMLRLGLTAEGVENAEDPMSQFPFLFKNLRALSVLCGLKILPASDFGTADTR